MRRPLVLDIDLDYFVEPIRRAAADVDGCQRPHSQDCIVREADEVQDFLERRCHLSAAMPIPGRGCEFHREVYYQIDSLIGKGALQAPLNLIHIDAHDDLGGSTTTDEVHSANYLLHCIRRDWIDYLVLVLPSSEWAIPSHILSVDRQSIEFGSHHADYRFLREDELDLPVSPDYCFVTRSPDFTPESADAIFEVIASYTSG